MNFTLHLTDMCNLRCEYCTQTRNGRRMSLNTVKRLIDLSVKNSLRTGFCFYGGEPMLEFSLIRQIIDYCKTLDHRFSFKMNTNGLLLNEETVKYLSDNNVGIGLSIDGLMQKSRKMPDGSDSLEAVSNAARLVLEYQPKAASRTVISPENVDLFYDSVLYLLDLGFKTVITTPAYGKFAAWDDEKLRRLRIGYEKVSSMYADRFGTDVRFGFPELESKILTHIRGGISNVTRCHSDLSQCSVNPEGNIYPCIQFVDRDEYIIGTAEKGFFADRVSSLILHKSPKECEGCALSDRCLNFCGCTNLIETGQIDRISPFHCEHERMLIDIADRLGESLYSKYPEKFIQVFYK